MGERGSCIPRWRRLGEHHQLEACNFDHLTALAIPRRPWLLPQDLLPGHTEDRVEKRGGGGWE